MSETEKKNHFKKQFEKVWEEFIDNFKNTVRIDELEKNYFLNL